jgi:nucleotide-binding universal stress UspA family protein
MLAIHRILVPVDFSEHSEYAFEQAIGLAKTFGAELHLLHCYQLFPVGAAAASYDLMIPESYERAVRESVTTSLSRWREKASAQGIPAEKHVRADIPAHGIIALAEELPADLIVMGTRGLTGFQHVLLGSVAERTVRLAPCPVLTVKPKVAR